MITEMFGIFDTKAHCFSQPIFCQNVDVLMRLLKRELQNPQSHYRLEPSDFVLYRTGTFNDETGEIKCIEHDNICSLDNLIEKPLERRENND